MTTYYLTFLVVAYFGAMAQWADKGIIAKGQWGRVRHSLPTLVFYLCASAILILVAALRYKVGTDFSAYYGDQITLGELATKWLELNEPGYYTLAYFAMLVMPVKAATTFIASVVTIGVMLSVLYRNTDSLLICLLLFMFLGCWHGGFNGVRQYLAVAILFVGYPFLRDRKPVQFFVCVAIAYLFHRSVACMALLYPIAHIEINARNVTLMVIGSLIVLFSYDRVLEFTGWLLNNNVANTQEGDAGYSYISTRVNGLRTAAGCAPAVCGLWYYWNKPKNDRLTFCLNIALVHGVLKLASSGSTYLARIAIYASPFLMMALPELLKPLPKKLRVPTTVVILALYAYFAWYEITNSGSLNNWQWVFGR